MTKKSLLVTHSTIFFLPFHLAIGHKSCPKKFRLDRKIGFQNTFYTKCIDVIIDSIGPSIISRSIHNLHKLIFISEPRHEISNNVVCVTSKAADQPAYMHSLIRAFASRLNIL